MDLITIHSTFDPVDADLVRARLEVAHFHPVLTNELSGMGNGFAIATDGILVQVPNDEAVSARDFLANSVSTDDNAPTGEDEKPQT